MNVKEIFEIIEDEDNELEVEICLGDNADNPKSYNAYPAVRQYSACKGELWLETEYDAVFSDKEEGIKENNLTILDLKGMLMHHLMKNYPENPNVMVYEDHCEGNFSIERVEKNRIYLKTE